LLAGASSFSVSGVGGGVGYFTSRIGHWQKMPTL
jgi:hypothetical protein